MIIGIDEVGRGAIAGPLVVGAVALPEPQTNFHWVSELRDSKKLSPIKREKLSQIISKNAIFLQLGWVSSDEIDGFNDNNIGRSLRLAAARSLVGLKLHPEDQIIIDGNVNFLKDTIFESNTTAVIKADDKIKAVSAASIIAKVARDRYMRELDQLYPKYGFKKHVGYGTKFHFSALSDFGPSPEHRLSYKIFQNDAKQDIAHNLSCGKTAEQKVAALLEKRGHQILARNFRTKFYEIDIISSSDYKIFFTEVKYRKSGNFGEPLESITPAKLKQMYFAAECFLSSYPTTKTPSLLAASVSGSNYKIDQILELG